MDSYTSHLLARLTTSSPHEIDEARVEAETVEARGNVKKSDVAQQNTCFPVGNIPGSRDTYSRPPTAYYALKGQ
jgi:hypothetical protein